MTTFVSVPVGEPPESKSAPQARGREALRLKHLRGSKARAFVIRQLGPRGINRAEPGGLTRAQRYVTRTPPGGKNRPPDSGDPRRPRGKSSGGHPHPEVGRSGGHSGSSPYASPSSSTRSRSLAEIPSTP